MTGSSSWHLVFPLFSSLAFVLGMLIGKRAIAAGVSPWTSTFLANLWLAIYWAGYGAIQGEWLSPSQWWPAIIVGALFVTGQVLNFFAFQQGDVSVATPIFGVKVILVAILLALLDRESVDTRIWIGAALATCGVGLVQAGARAKPGQRRSLWNAASTVCLSLASATCFSLFDVGLQLWGRPLGATRFLPIVFVSGGVLSCGLLPLCHPPRRWRELSVTNPLIVSTLLIAAQAISMAYSLGHFGDATRINIIYALRGLWALGLAWLLRRALATAEANLSGRVLGLRLLGAILLTAAVIISIS
ncbi:MAG: EamA family transporter [Planctomycetota bacterium]